MKRLMIVLCLVTNATEALAGGPPQRKAIDDYEVLLAETSALVKGLREKTPDDVVMIRKIEGDGGELVKKALVEALLAAGMRTANTKEEIEALRAHYRDQGIDVYQNPEFQKLLTETMNAKVAVDAEHRCRPSSARELTCVLWLRAYLPATLMFAGHRGYAVAAPAPARGTSPRGPSGEHAPFFWLLAAYALVPAFFHRLDIQLRRPDGAWRSAAYLPVHAAGNRLTAFLATLSFMIVGPTCFERWVLTLEHHPRAELMNFLVALATMSVLAFAGSVVFSLWPLRSGEHRHRATFRELFVLHPDFWTKRIEGRAAIEA